MQNGLKSEFLRVFGFWYEIRPETETLRGKQRYYVCLNGRIISDHFYVNRRSAEAFIMRINRKKIFESEV